MSARIYALRTAVRIRDLVTGPFISRRVAATEKRFSANAGNSDDYAEYVRAQVAQTRAKRNKDGSFRVRPAVDLIVERCELPENASVLSIGARNVVELDVLESKGFTDVTAIDLWPTSSRITQADMHDIPFPDDSFDLIFASHAFEHSYDFSKVSAECTRVLKDGGYIWCAVPIDFEPNDHDRVDFGNGKTLIEFFAGSNPEVLVEDTDDRELKLLFRLHTT